MKKAVIPALYKKYHIDRDYGLESIFAEVAERFSVRSVLYPGCYVHITPSFFIPRAVYVDLEKPAKRFFDNPDVLAYIKQQKHYAVEPEVTFYHQSYTEPIDEPEESFDLLVSQYAGFISEPTKKYLKPGGILLVNNSHGDAGLASLDTDFKLVGVVTGSGISEENLDQYFIPKKNIEISAAYLKELGRGIGYEKTALNYLFEKV